MLLHTFLLVFIAEMADKTQLMMMALCNRYSVRSVVLGMGAGIAGISALSVCAGDIIGDIIPIRIVKVAAALMFLGFGLFNLMHSKEEEDNKGIHFRLPVVSIAFTFMLAELGDKTQLATVALAANHMDQHIQVFLGGAFGLFFANLVGIFAGKLIFAHVSEDAMKVGSSFLFFLFGSITLFEAVDTNIIIVSAYSVVLIGIAYFIYTLSRKTKES